MIIASSYEKDKDSVFHTNHPEHGQIVQNVDWSKRGADVLIPKNFTDIVDEKSITSIGSTTPSFNPGMYSALLFTTVGCIYRSKSFNGAFFETRFYNCPNHNRL